MKAFLAPILAILIFTRCDKEELPAAKNGKLNQDVEIALNETLELTTNGDDNTNSGNVRVHLAELTDSRCPSNVNCIRYGSAVARLWLEKDNERSDTAELVIGEALPTDTRKLRIRSADTTLVTVDNTQYQVILKSVLPYPCTSCPDQGEPHANIVVTEK
ncbi:MAG: hypothetical protein M3Q05_05665 [Bacteroidota bacterium]|nr:hypothetical protein [Bacteroidota bacterium]